MSDVLETPRRPKKVQILFANFGFCFVLFVGEARLLAQNEVKRGQRGNDHAEQQKANRATTTIRDAGISENADGIR